MLHHSIPAFKLLKVHYGHREPCTEHSRSHRRRTFVHHLDQRCAFLSSSRGEYLEVAEGEAVHPYERILIYAGDRADVAQFIVLGLFQVYQKSSGRSDRKRESVYCKSLQRIDLKLSFKLFYGIVIYEGPFLEGRYVIMISIPFLCALLVASRHEKLLRSKRAQEGSYVVERTFRDLECTCRDIQKRSAALVLVECQSSYVVMLLLLEKLVAERDTRSHELRDASLDDLLSQLRVFQLVADRNLVACTHKSGKVCLEGMMRKSRHRNCSGNGAGTLCKHDSEHLAGCQCIISVCLVKIAAPEQKHCFRMLRLHREELLHHRCFGRFLFCHNLYYYILAKVPILIGK